jgi:large subunit ribosomal protein L22
MEAKAIARFVRVTPRKADQVLQLIRGKRVDQCTEILDFTPKHVAKLIGKVLKSAVANAVAIEGKINVEELRVKYATAGAGPTMKRFLPRAQGRATPILKRTCHITVVVEGEVHEEATMTRRARRVAPKAAKPAEPKATKTAKVEEPPAPAAKKGAKKAEPKKAAAKTKKSKEAK